MFQEMHNTCFKKRNPSNKTPQKTSSKMTLSQNKKDVGPEKEEQYKESNESLFPITGKKLSDICDAFNRDCDDDRNKLIAERIKIEIWYNDNLPYNPFTVYSLLSSILAVFIAFIACILGIINETSRVENTVNTLPETRQRLHSIIEFIFRPIVSYIQNGLPMIELIVLAIFAILLFFLVHVMVFLRNYPKDYDQKRAIYLLYKTALDECINNHPARDNRIDEPLGEYEKERDIFHPCKKNSPLHLVLKYFQKHKKQSGFNKTTGLP